MRYLLIAVLLAGCAEMRQTRVDNAISEMGRACDKIGYQPGSEQHKECVTRLLAAQTGRSGGGGTVRSPMTCTTIGGTTNCN